MILNFEEIIADGKEVIRIEAESIAKLQFSIDENFVKAVTVLQKCTGRVVLTGLGKSGIIARKIVATLNSTGSPAIYLHPVDALHGDLGMVRKEDVVILLSKSGATEEMLMLVPMIKRLGIPIIGILGDINSKLGQEVDIALNVKVDEEACPYDLAPTASTTASLAMGDALSVALLKQRGFTQNDFAMLHPAGSLGKRLSLKISEIMSKGVNIPIVMEDTSLKDSIVEITSKRLGMTCVLDKSGKLSGIVTDGDLRRLLETANNITGIFARDVMTKNPKVIGPDVLASFALQKMENFKITCLVIADLDKRPLGVVHLHDLVNLGLRIR